MNSDGLVRLSIYCMAARGLLPGSCAFRRTGRRAVYAWDLAAHASRTGRLLVTANLPATAHHTGDGGSSSPVNRSGVFILFIHGRRFSLRAVPLGPGEYLRNVVKIDKPKIPRSYLI